MNRRDAVIALFALGAAGSSPFVVAQAARTKVRVGILPAGSPEATGHLVAVFISPGASRSSRRRAAAARKRSSTACPCAWKLQADCYAGVWGHHVGALNLREAGDVEEGLNAAMAIGDDRLQRQAQGRVVPESFTHGTSEQRLRWFKRGLDSGRPQDCDTFSARTL